MTGPPLRLAVHGAVSPSAGSSATSHSLVIEELLRRGHHVDFYAIMGFGDQGHLTAWPNCRLIELALPVADRGLGWLMARRNRAFRVHGAFVWNTLRELAYGRLVGRTLARADRRRRYDGVLVVDRMPDLGPVRPAGTVCWPQGCPTAELEPIVRSRRDVIRWCGRPFYLAFVGYYRYRVAAARTAARGYRTVVSGSRVISRHWERLGVPAGHAVACPYSADLTQFRPQPSATPPDPFTFLHLGRIVPRKRPDLLLEGFQLFRKAVPDARLVVVGSVVVGAGLNQLLADPRLTANVDFPGRLPRDQVPGLFARVGGLVQTSENEDFGSAVMEAHLCGVPVLVGPTNGTADYISPRSVVFADYTPAAVAAGLAELRRRCLADWAGVRAEARATAEQHFAVGTVADRVLAVVTAARGGA